MDQPEAEWLDPRPSQSASQPASRAGVTNRRLVLFDNGKLGPPYLWRAPIVPALMTILNSLGVATLERRNLLSEDPEQFIELVNRWKAENVDGVLFGLCDAGVVQPTLLLAAIAEKAGIPTVTLCTPALIDFGAVAASFMVSGLPLVEFRDSRTASAEDITSAIAKIGSQIRNGLTAAPEQLVESFQTRFPFVSGLGRSERSVAGKAFPDIARAEYMGDGLPLVTPTPASVQHAIEVSGRRADDVVIDSMTPSGAPLTVRQIAICATMAGCTAERLPFVLAAFEAMSAPEYRLHLATITTHPGGNLILCSGKAAIDAGIESGRGCLGPGFEANATIGRAISLAIINVGRAIPGLSALSLHGSPSQFTYCFADALDSPFAPLQRELCGPEESGAIVWVQKCDSPHDVLDSVSRTPESLLGTFAKVAATVGGNNAYLPSDLLLVLNPDHAAIIADAGWKRADIQNFIWEKARNLRKDLSGRGSLGSWPPEWAEMDPVPVVPGPDRVWMVVAGGAGTHSLVMAPWGYASAVWRKVR